MKFATGWWGVQILAETESDKKILGELVQRLPQETDNAYDDGTIEIISEKQDACWGFQTEEIQKSKMVVAINR
jgi:hypothetical protein